MTDFPVDELTQRVERLERENGRLKRVGAVIVFGIVAAFLMGQAMPRSTTVEAQRFVLKDKRGTVRAVLGGAAVGDATGEVVGLLVYDKKHVVRAVLALREDDSPALSLADEKANERVIVDTSSGMQIIGNGPRLSLGVQLGNEPTLQLFDKDGWMRSSLSLADSSGAPVVKFNDPRGDTRATITVGSNGKAQLMLMTSPRVPGKIPGWATLAAEADGAMSLQFFRAGVIWKAP